MIYDNILILSTDLKFNHRGAVIYRYLPNVKYIFFLNWKIFDLLLT